MAVKRVRDLEILLEFVQLATKEMMWMNQLEDEHANRDWSPKNLNIAELEKHYKVRDQANTWAIGRVSDWKTIIEQGQLEEWQPSFF